MEYSPVSFVIKNQLDGSTKKTHAKDIRLANVHQWAVLIVNRPRTLRQTQYAEPPGLDTDASGSDLEEDVPETLNERFRDERTDSYH